MLSGCGEPVNARMQEIVKHNRRNVRASDDPNYSPLTKTPPRNCAGRSARQIIRQKRHSTPRCARSKKPPGLKSTDTRENPDAFSLAFAALAANGTNVLCVCAKRCSQPL
jgi:hypothetical protein